MGVASYFYGIYTAITGGTSEAPPAPPPPPTPPAITQPADPPAATAPAAPARPAGTTAGTAGSSPAAPRAPAKPAAAASPKPAAPAKAEEELIRLDFTRDPKLRDDQLGISKGDLKKRRTYPFITNNDRKGMAIFAGHVDAAPNARDKARIDAINKALAERFGKDVRVKFAINPSRTCAPNTLSNRTGQNDCDKQVNPITGKPEYVPTPVKPGHRSDASPATARFVQATRGKASYNPTYG